MKTRIEEWKSQELPKHYAQCGGACCGRNLSNLTEDQVALIFGENRTALNSHLNPILKRSERTNLYETDYVGEDVCPQLQNNRCAIHEHPQRPQECQQFPVALDEKGRMIMDNYSCPATADLANVADLCLEAKRKGYEVQYMFGIREITMAQILNALRSRAISTINQNPS